MEVRDNYARSGWQRRGGGRDMYEIQIDFRKLRAEVKLLLHPPLIFQSTREEWSATLTSPPTLLPFKKKKKVRNLASWSKMTWFPIVERTSQAIVVGRDSKVILLFLFFLRFSVDRRIKKKCSEFSKTA